MEYIYNVYIYERFSDLLKSGKKVEEINNYDLAKIFEYFSCIKLSQEYKQTFYEYNDICPTFKEKNNMSRTDTGIDACNLIDTIVQCKLRKNTLNWRDCSTFFGSNIYVDENNNLKTKWNHMIITRNSESKLAPNLKDKHKLFIDKTYSHQDIIDYCLNLINNPPNNPIENQSILNKIINEVNNDTINNEIIINNDNNNDNNNNDTINNLIIINDSDNEDEIIEINIRDSINKNKLSDYIINIPIFDDDIYNNLCKYLLKNYRNMFIYCNNKDESMKINNILNKLQNNSSDLIKSDKQFTVSNDIIEANYSGICLLNLSSPDIIKVALKLDKYKNYANIIIPYLQLCPINFIKKINDYRINKSLNNKVLGGYISIDRIYSSEYTDEIDNKYETLFNKIHKNTKHNNEILN